jgi:LysR family glycine cleavage system transcriptional activator
MPQPLSHPPQPPVAKTTPGAAAASGSGAASTAIPAPPFAPSAARRIPPIQCLLTFEALARLRSVAQTADELCVTASAVSHRVKQLEQLLGVRLLGRSDFALTADGTAYLAHVREGLGALQRFPGTEQPLPGQRRLQLAVTPTFARAVLIPRLRQFTDAYPEIDLTLQVSVPRLDAQPEDADLMVRFGAGGYADVEHLELPRDRVTPLASPAFVREHGPFEQPADLEGVALLRSPLDPWRTWFAAAGLNWAEPRAGSQFNDVGLICDAAAAGMGVALVRLRLGAPWLDNGSLVRLFATEAASPHTHYLCWRPGTMERWECTAFADWLRKTLA